MAENSTIVRPRDVDVKKNFTKLTHFDATTLTPCEVAIIQKVLQKDEQFRLILEKKIRQVRKEIEDIHRSGPLAGGYAPQDRSTCAVCDFKFSRFCLLFFAQGQMCTACNLFVCSKCTETEPNGGPLCILCFKQRQEKLLAGKLMPTRQFYGLHGSELIKAMLAQKHDKGKGQNVSRVENIPDNKLEVDRVTEDKTRSSNTRQRRESYSRALDSQKTALIPTEGNKGGGKPHGRKKDAQLNHDRVETKSSRHGSQFDPEDSSFGSHFSDTQHASRDTNKSISSEDTNSMSGGSLNDVNTSSQLVRKGKGPPAAIPSRFQFRRSSSLSQRDMDQKDNLVEPSKQKDNTKTTGSKSKTKIITRLINHAGHFSSNTKPLADEINGKNVKANNKRKNPCKKISDVYTQKTPADEDCRRLKTISGSNDDTEVQKSKVTRIWDLLTGRQDPTQKGSDKNRSSTISKEQQNGAEKESMQDTDSGITSGHSSRTTTPEQRSQLTVSPTNPQAIPVIAVTNTGDQSVDEGDDGLEELFLNRLPNQLLGSRSSLADSRESINSVYSDAGEVNYGRIPVTGEIMFHICYNHTSSSLEVHIKQCRDLAPVDTKHSRSDPYVKTYLLPDKSRASKRKTRIKKHTLNPVFDEVLKYQINSADLESRSLWLTVWHNDRLGRNDFLGEVTIPLDYYRLDQSSPMWYPLLERAVSQEPVMFYKGDLFVALKYIPADLVEATPKKKSNSFRRKNKEKEAPVPVLGEVHVLVREAQNLTAMRGAAGSNPFCKGYILPNVAHSSKQKTPVIKKTTNPQWQHILVFEGVDESQLHENGLELTIWDHEKLSSNDFLGGVRLNLGYGIYQGQPADWMDAKGEEIVAWQSMMEHPNEWIDAELPLRASMGKQTVKN